MVGKDGGAIEARQYRGSFCFEVSVGKYILHAAVAGRSGFEVVEGKTIKEHRSGIVLID